ncbi:unnamed protein product (macronuclear) [Paramecium tetraurelia]|uniref:Reverse transcriptase domain-containing protein n=1 Tax=Paramecium tetraurelia TaxID=5888 RepID=A0D4A3_PARTE|nr:uncharacterized protein GSPATT00013336001 [Paramecium tetraurelia]CAK77870.1 unnamed protein product [Paramecium tetraurelia]|eukprot:XP_001445267.1 hypothetical protein (macronuclear) [Paramecium tetraurelia strain d4-2]
MSKPGIGLNSIHIAFIQKSFGDIDEEESTKVYSERTLLENKVRFADDILICFFHQQDKVTQINEGKKKSVKDFLK